MPMHSVNWAEALVPGIYNFFEIGRRLRPSLLPALYNVASSSLAEENFEGIGGVSPDAWNAWEFTGNKAEAKFQKGFLTTFQHLEKPIQFIVERKLVDDEKYGIIASRARRLGISAAQRQEIDGASVFNNAFSDTYAGADGVGLCSTAHPDSPNDSAVQVNEGTYVLNAQNISTVRVAMMGFKDDEGNPLGITPNLILVPPELEDTALEATKSLQKPDSAENNINPQVGRFVVQPWHQLTDTGAWFMIDMVWMKESLLWLNRAPLEFALVNRTLTEFQYEAYMRYSWGWIDWRWLFGNKPS